MRIKLPLLLIAIGCLSLWAAPASQASGVVTDSFGEAASEITVVSNSSPFFSEAQFTTTWGNIVCDTIDLKISLSENSETTAKGSGAGTAKGAKGKHEGPCLIGGVSNVTFTKVSAENFDLNGSGGGTAAFTIGFDVGQFYCEYHNFGSVVSYQSGDNNFQLQATMHQTVNSSPFCPAQMGIHSEFEVWDEYGGQALIH